MTELFERDDAGPMTIRVSFPKLTNKDAKKKAKDAKDALIAFAKM